MSFRYPKDVIVQVCTCSTWDNQPPVKRLMSGMATYPTFRAACDLSCSVCSKKLFVPPCHAQGSCRVEVARTICLQASQWSLILLLGSHVPKGPTISSVFGSSVVVTSCFRLAGGSRNLRSTPCGVDKGALPIRDRDLEVPENGLDV